MMMMLVIVMAMLILNFLSIFCGIYCRGNLFREGHL